MQQTKVIITKDIKRWKCIRSCTFVIPVIFFILGLNTTSTLWKENVTNMEDAVIGAGGIILSTLISALPVMLIWWTISNQMLKSAIKRSRFQNIQDIEYYREKLSGLSPAMISLLTDLHIETEKDITATLLKLQMNGVIEIQNNKIIVLKPEDGTFDNSDHILLESLGESDLSHKSELKSRLNPWIGAVISDAYASPYFKAPERFQMKGCLSGCVTPIVSIIALILLIHSGPYKYIMNTIEIEGLTEAQFRRMLLTDPQLLLGMLFIILIFIFMLTIFISPVLFIIRGLILAQTAENVRLQRTELGKETMEYIYGLKNFIHDFSNLSEATKDQLVLWDDFLIYAVLLEENEIIRKEIFQKRNMNISI